MSILCRAGLQVVEPRAYRSVTREEQRLLAAAASHAGFVPDYAAGAVQEAAYFIVLSDALLQGDTGAIVHRDELIAESLLHLKKSARAPGYRTPRSRSLVRKRGRHASIYYLPEGSGNLYHWLVDCLPRLRLLTSLPDRRLTLICHASMTPYQRLTLRKALSHFPEVALIEIPPDEDWILEEYVFMSFASGLNSGFLSPFAARFIRDALVPREPRYVASDKPRRLYVSRATATKRRLTSEQELRHALGRLEFTTIRPECLPFEEQVSAFNAAEIVVGVHGAGLANILFADRCTVVELQACTHVRPHYLLLAKALGHRYRGFLGSVADDCEDFDVDVPALCRRVARLCRTS